MWCQRDHHWYTTSSTTTTTTTTWSHEGHVWDLDDEWHTTEATYSTSATIAVAASADDSWLMYIIAIGKAVREWVVRQQWVIYEHCFPLFYVLHHGCMIRMQMNGFEHVAAYTAHN